MKFSANLNKEFDEKDYLDANPDVAHAVEKGEFKSGREHFELCGKFEGRAISPSSLTSRQTRVLSGLNLSGLGMEIGPSHNPLAPKRQGFNVHILDHLCTEDLKIKYQNHEVNIENIEDVDFVWTGGSIVDLVSGKEKYDWIIASHVIEHIPNPISFLQDCGSLLKHGGKLSLIIPDKRYCFDVFSPLSTTGSVLDAWHEKRVRPSPGQVFDMYANSARLNGAIAWGKDVAGVYELGEPGPVGPGGQASEMWERAFKTDEYCDVHCWRFTPLSFQLIINDVASLGLMPLKVCDQQDTIGCEFYVTLQKNDDKYFNSGNRIDVLKRINGD